MGVGFGIGLGEIHFLCQNSFAHTCEKSPIQIHPPPPSIAKRASRMQQPHPPRRTYGMTLAGKYPYKDFYVKSRTFGEEYGDFGA